MPERPLTTRQLKLVVANAVLLVLAWGVIVLAGMRANIQGNLEIAAYGTLILFFGALFVQLALITWLERRSRSRRRTRS